MVDQPPNMGIKGSNSEPIEVAPQVAGATEPVDVNEAGSFRALMKFYESGESLDEESETDLMVELSGMVCDLTVKQD